MTDRERYLAADQAMIEAATVLDLIAAQSKEPLVAHIAQQASDRLWVKHREIEEQK